MSLKERTIARAIEHYSIIESIIKDHGYELATHLGIRSNGFCSELKNLERLADASDVTLPPKVYRSIGKLIGILKPREQIERSFLGFKQYKKQRGLYIGQLYIDDPLKGIVFGREYILELTALAKDVAKRLNVNRLDIGLFRETPYLERYSTRENKDGLRPFFDLSLPIEDFSIDLGNI